MTCWAGYRVEKMSLLSGLQHEYRLKGFWCKRLSDEGSCLDVSVCSVEALFNGRHFDRQVIILCVTWYTSFKLSFRDLTIIMAERGIALAHTTILHWVQHYLPEFEKRWKRYARPVGGSWRRDETYIKVCAQWAISTGR
jgi:hypothetical protein